MHQSAFDATTKEQLVHPKRSVSVSVRNVVSNTPALAPPIAAA
ncbi:hypothetical protein [Dubosiella newyorkensis]